MHHARCTPSALQASKINRIDAFCHSTATPSAATTLIRISSRLVTQRNRFVCCTISPNMNMVRTLLRHALQSSVLIENQPGAIRIPFIVYRSCSFYSAALSREHLRARCRLQLNKTIAALICSNVTLQIEFGIRKKVKEKLFEAKNDTCKYVRLVPSAQCSGVVIVRCAVYTWLAGSQLHECRFMFLLELQRIAHHHHHNTLQGL